MHKIRKEKAMTQIGRPQSDNKKMIAINLSLPQGMLKQYKHKQMLLGNQKV